MSFSGRPQQSDRVRHFLKLARMHDRRDIVVAYWSRRNAIRIGMNTSWLLPDDDMLFFIGVMDWLEEVKAEEPDNDAITKIEIAHDYLGNYAIKLFRAADKLDRKSKFGKKVVKTFYMSAVVYELCKALGELSDESLFNCMYAKWRAAYIQNCLKLGVTPQPNPMLDDVEEILCSHKNETLTEECSLPPIEENSEGSQTDAPEVPGAVTDL